MSELVTINIENHIADVKFNRPEKYNALSHAMMMAMAEALNQLADEKQVRAVVVSGNGKGFCAGLDFENFQAMGSGSGEKNELTSLTDRYEDRISNLPQHIAYGWKQLPMPVIAAIHGVAFGGGCQIAMGADIRLARPDAKLSIMEMKWGLIPDMSASQTIRDIVSIDVAKELYFTAKIISGEDAAKMRLVTRTCENPYEEAMALAKEIASKSPTAVRAAKKLLNEVWHGRDDARGLLMESELEMTLIGLHNQLEAIKANFENRTPEFKDPE